MNQSDVCLNCGKELYGMYCSNCGQKKLEPRERTIRHFVYQFFGAAFFLENNFFRNLWLLLVRPGFLASEHLDGRRRRYMAPLSLFLLINLVYFFTVKLSDLNLSLREQLFQPFHGVLAQSMVEKRLAERGTTIDEYAAIYNDQSTSLSKTLIILHAPVLALLLGLWYIRKKYYFTDHVIFSVYLIAFILLFSVLIHSILFLAVKYSIIPPDSFFRIYGWTFLIVYPCYFAIAIRRFYRQSWLWTLIKTVLVMISFVVAHFVYRALLFLIVFWTT